MTYKEAQETDVFVIENNEINEINLCEHIFESIDETTTPRGVAPRDFIEEYVNLEDYFDDDDDDDEQGATVYVEGYSYISFKKLLEYNIKKLYTISTWGCTGNKYSQGNEYYASLESVEEAYFQNVYNYDFQKDDQRITTYYDSFEEAEKELSENLAYDWDCSEKTAKHILRKQKIVKELRKIQEEKLRKAEKIRIENLSNIYLKGFSKIEGEKYGQTAKRFNEFIRTRIESNVFHYCVRKIRR